MNSKDQQALIDAVKISDILDQGGITYYADIKSHMLYVNQDQSELARIQLAKIGIVIDYPAVSTHNDLNHAYEPVCPEEKNKDVNFSCFSYFYWYCSSRCFDFSNGW